MPERVKDFFYYLPLQFIFYSLWIVPTYLIWSLTGSWLATVIGFFVVANPLALLITFWVAMKYPDVEDDDFAFISGP